MFTVLTTTDTERTIQWTDDLKIATQYACSSCGTYYFDPSECTCDLYY